jgi:hypothetical protein
MPSYADYLNGQFQQPSYPSSLLSMGSRALGGGALGQPQVPSAIGAGMFPSMTQTPAIGQRAPNSDLLRRPAGGVASGRANRRYPTQPTQRRVGIDGVYVGGQWQPYPQQPGAPPQYATNPGLGMPNRPQAGTAAPMGMERRPPAKYAPHGTIELGDVMRRKPIMIPV